MLGLEEFLKRQHWKTMYGSQLSLDNLKKQFQQTQITHRAFSKISLQNVPLFPVTDSGDP